MQFEIIVDERCFKTIEEFDNYTWQKDKDTGEYTNEPVRYIQSLYRFVALFSGTILQTG